MKKNLTELVFILDRSGSMSGLEADTIGGFNSMIERQKKQEGDVVISTVLFDDKVNVLHNRKDLKQIKKLTDRDYYVGGCTALLDALGGAITHIDKVQKELPEGERPEKTMFVITTDGMENASKEFNYTAIKNLVKTKQKKQGWEFLFLGANMDAIKAAGDIGIRADRSVRYHSDSAGTAVNYSALGKAVSRFRMAEPCCAAKALEGWDEEIKEDYASRNK